MKFIITPGFVGTPIYLISRDYAEEIIKALYELVVSQILEYHLQFGVNQ
jgi:hypothetical protein